MFKDTEEGQTNYCERCEKEAREYLGYKNIKNSCGQTKTCPLSQDIPKDLQDAMTTAGQYSNEEQKRVSEWIKKFRKKPVEVEAIQYDGSAKMFKEIQKWSDYFIELDLDFVPKLSIKTLEGKMTADVGDWIIKGVKGEFYPCKPDIFLLTYEGS